MAICFLGAGEGVKKSVSVVLRFFKGGWQGMDIASVIIWCFAGLFVFLVRLNRQWS